MLPGVPKCLWRGRFQIVLSRAPGRAPRDLKEPVSPMSLQPNKILGAVLAVIVCAALAPIVFSYWHLTLVFPFALFPLLLLMEHWSLGREEKVRRYLLLAACYCIAVNLVAATDSRKFSYGHSFGEQVERYLQQHPTLQHHTKAGE